MDPADGADLGRAASSRRPRRRPRRRRRRRSPAAWPTAGSRRSSSARAVGGQVGQRRGRGRRSRSRRSPEHLQRGRAVGDRRSPGRRSASRHSRMRSRRPASGSTTSRLFAGRPTKSFRRSSSSSSVSRVLIGLATKARAPEFRARSRASSVEMTHTGMWRVCDVVLEPLQHAPAVDVGQEDVQRDGVGLVLARHGQGGGAERRDQPLEALLAGRVQQEAGEAQVVLDDQQHAVAGLDVVAVVADLVDQRRRLGSAAISRGPGRGRRGCRGHARPAVTARRRRPATARRRRSSGRPACAAARGGV